MCVEHILWYILFFDGSDSDNEIGIKAKPSGNRGKAQPKKKPIKPATVIHERINLESDDEEIKEPPKKRRLVENG